MTFTLNLKFVLLISSCAICFIWGIHVGSYLLEDKCIEMNEAQEQYIKDYIKSEYYLNHFNKIK